MSEPVPRRPPTPRPAERARTIASRSGPASLWPALGGTTPPTPAPEDPAPDHVAPPLWHLHGGHDVSVLLPDAHPFTSSVEQPGSGELAVTLEVTDLAPVELRQPVRGLLWLTGWLRALDERSARARATTITEARPDPRMLDLGHGLTMLRLTPVSVVVADGEGTHSLSPATFDAAAPDPFGEHERHWLTHLEHAHTDVVTQLARHVPEELRAGTVRPLGLDRHGLRLRVETGTGDHDVRLAFSRPVEDPAHLAIELRKLVGCPFLRRSEGRAGRRP